jgi:hypothetical protein
MVAHGNGECKCHWRWYWHDGCWGHLEPIAAADEGLAQADGTVVKPSIGSVWAWVYVVVP